jgi:hypothetical protein
VNLRVGDRVQVRSKPEILATLDERGCLDGLPFMPQMLDSCGKRFRVSKRAHKLCDTVNGTGARRMTNAVFLDDLRCDGQAYGGCEMECLIFWKEAWLERVSVAEDGDHERGRPLRQQAPSPRLHELVLRHARSPEKHDTAGGPIYSCQATKMPSATTALSVWNLRQYVEDIRSGNARLGQILSVLFFLVYDAVATSGLGLGSFMKWTYDKAQRLRGGTPYPSRPGRLPRHSRTPSMTLGLLPGEIVKVKTHEAVLETLNEDLINRGMSFHTEMVPYCDRSFRVSKSVRRIMNEKTGQLTELKNACVVLEGAPCVGRYTKPLLCPRGMSPYWREIWLERIEPAGCTNADAGRRCG